MLATTPLISVEKYLSTTYEYDMDYLDGTLVERAMPDGPHSVLQRLIVAALSELEKSYDVVVLPEIRVLVSEPPVVKYRVADVCLAWNPPPRGPLLKPPLVVVEIVSPTDPYRDHVAKCLDYMHRGIPHIRVVDPLGDCHPARHVLGVLVSRAHSHSGTRRRNSI